MADVPTTAWSENTPAGSDSINAGDNRIREMKTQIREVIGVDHDFPSSGQDDSFGQHLRATLQEQTDLGSGVTGTNNTTDTGVGICILGAQTVGTGTQARPELIFTDEDDNDVQLTSGGKVDLGAGRLDNEEYLIARNADDDDNVSLLRARTLATTEENYTTADDVVEVAPSMVVIGDISVVGDTTGASCINGVQADNLIAREAVIMRESSGYTTDEDEAALYAKNDGTQTELYFKGEDDGDEVQITKDGGLNHKLGSWASKSAGVVYEALTDGFAVGYANDASTNDGVYGYTDSSNPPTTLRIHSGEATDQSFGITMPVKKGDYWKVTGVTSLFWIPIGS